MPGYTVEIKPEGKTRAVARATLRTPGNWGDQTDEQRKKFNEATRAINALIDLYDSD